MSWTGRPAVLSARQRAKMRVRQALCRHEWVRKGTNYHCGGTVWACPRCGREETWPASKGRLDAEGYCSVCGRPVARDERECPHHRLAEVLAERPTKSGRTGLRNGKGASDGRR